MSLCCDIIILAGGSSGRLGRPKQLLPYKNTILLQYLIDEAKRSTAGSVIVVLGYQAEIIQAELKTSTTHIAINDLWKEGMSSSIRCGIRESERLHPDASAVLLMTCDQPFVTASLLNDLIKAHTDTGKLIITSGYDNIQGPPAVFHRKLFPELKQLAGDAGAKSIVQQYSSETHIVLFPKGATDIDTIKDYEDIS